MGKIFFFRKKIFLATEIHFFDFFVLRLFDRKDRLAVSDQSEPDMAPFKRIARSPEEAKAAGCSSILNYFSPAPKKGRRTKNSKAAGRAKNKVDPQVKAPKTGPKTADATTPAVTEATKVKKTRRSWSSGERLQLLTQAMQDWAAEKAKPKASQQSMRDFAKCKSIPFSTFQEHAVPDTNKRRKLGSGVGAKPLITQLTANVVVDTLIRKDRANQGEGVSGAIDMIEELQPGLSRKQISLSFRRTVRPKFKHRLTNPVAAQHSTTKRSAITVAQQFRWHKVMILCFPSIISSCVTSFFFCSVHRFCVFGTSGTKHYSFLFHRFISRCYVPFSYRIGRGEPACLRWWRNGQGSW